MNNQDRIEPYHLNRKWKTVRVELLFDAPIERSNVTDFIHENIASFNEKCGANLMVATTQPGFEEWDASIKAFHGFDKTANEVDK